MATNSFTSTSSWTVTNALQPDRVTPIGLPVYSDTTPTQIVESEILLPASTQISLALPSGWTNITHVRIVNTDKNNYLNLQFVAAGSSIVLAPNGGEFMLTQAFNTTGATPAAIPLLAGQTAFPAYGTWKLQGVTLAGTAAGSTTSAYVWLAGY